MSKLNLSTILAFVFIALLLAASLYFNISKPRVMILHSYDPEYAWSRDIDVGLHRVVDKWVDYSVTWHYMDTKKHADPKWLKRAGIVARRSIDKVDPHVLIAIDDYAQNLAARHYVNSPTMNIVFAGVNGSVEPYGYVGAKNVTGIFERKQLRAVKETVLAFEAARPEPQARPKLMYILDPSQSLQNDREFITNHDWAPVDFVGSEMAEDFEHWKKLIDEAGQKADYIMVANYRKLPASISDPGFVRPGEVMKWTEEHSAVPVIGVNVFNVEDGAMISVGVSPYEQGEVAAQMAERILEEGIKAGEIPMQMNKQYVIAMRQLAMERRGVRLPSIYEAFGRATANYFD